VDDVRPFQAKAEVVVVPVRAGGGTRLKVLEAAACGKAIVSTPLGVEGLSFRPGHDLVVADAPEGFAAATAALLLDPARRAELGARALAVASRYEWADIGDSFRRILEDVPRG
jgi:glycosyltransferase involved in cell wall biosynthesis